ncbi:MAG TPA: hypothetical protein VFB02_02280 [Bradyrhizobium sp.]|nr:hypothetical protein [Bradyrhizobium sp.]
MGRIYSAPYACLEPDLALVVEDSAGVAGFAVGTTDTQSWEMRLEREWWPVYECSTLILREHLAIGQQTKSAVP